MKVLPFRRDPETGEIRFYSRLDPRYWLARMRYRRLVRRLRQEGRI